MKIKYSFLMIICFVAIIFFAFGIDEFVGFAQETPPKKENKAKKLAFNTFFVAILEPNPDAPLFNPEKLQQIRMGHFKNIKKMEAAGKLVVAGPFDNGGGLFILKVDSKEKANALVQQDPAIQNKLLLPKIHTWWAVKNTFVKEVQWNKTDKK